MLRLKDSRRNKPLRRNFLRVLAKGHVGDVEEPDSFEVAAMLLERFRENSNRLARPLLALIDTKLSDREQARLDGVIRQAVLPLADAEIADRLFMPKHQLLLRLNGLANRSSPAFKLLIGRQRARRIARPQFFVRKPRQQQPPLHGIGLNCDFTLDHRSPLAIAKGILHDVLRADDLLKSGGHLLDSRLGRQRRNFCCHPRAKSKAANSPAEHTDQFQHKHRNNTIFRTFEP